MIAACAQTNEVCVTGEGCFSPVRGVTLIEKCAVGVRIKREAHRAVQNTVMRLVTKRKDPVLRGHRSALCFCSGTRQASHYTGPKSLRGGSGLRNKEQKPMIQPQAMQDAQAWLAGALEALRRPEASEYPEVDCLSQTWGTMAANRSVIGGPLMLNGRIYECGLGTHVQSRIEVTLPAPGVRLTGLAGPNDDSEVRAEGHPLDFAVEVNGVEVWRAEQRRVNTAPASVDADLRGASKFLLTVNGPMPSGHANWVDLRVTLADGRTCAIDCGPRPRPCVSFGVDEKSSQTQLFRWALTEEHCAPKDGKAVHRITRTDPVSGLQLRVDVTAYLDFPVVEWVARLRNTSGQTSPIVRDICSLDVSLALEEETYLNHNRGDYCTSDSYQPFRDRVRPGANLAFAPEGGCPTNKAWPYFNLEYPGAQSGVIVCLGWPGQWAARFQAQGGGVKVKGGQELTHFRLLPGEEVRTPLSVLLFYRGDRVQGQNIWRRWMVAHNIPRPGGAAARAVQRDLPGPAPVGKKRDRRNRPVSGGRGQTRLLVDGRGLVSGGGVVYAGRDLGAGPGAFSAGHSGGLGLCALQRHETGPVV